MADNVAITAGTGTTIHADEYVHGTYGTGKSQVVKLALGAPGTGVDAVAGAGVVDTGTQRVTLASDDPAVTSLAIIDNMVFGAGTEAGALRVTFPTDGTGVVGLTGAALTALQLIDDVIFVDDTATHATGTTKVVGIGAVATPTDTAVSANDIGMVAMSLNRGLHVQLQTSSGVDIGNVGIGSALPAGTALIGKVGIDQTTPGTTDHVTADLGATDNAVLDAIAASLAIIDGTVFGAGTEAGALRVTLPTDGTGVVNLGATDNAVLDNIQTAVEVLSAVGIIKVSANFNRPADTTAYANNDAVNDNATAGGGSSTELSWAIPRAAGVLRRIRIKKTDQTVATPTIRLWLYDTIFTSGAGDNEAFVHPATDSIGRIDVPVTTAGSDDAVGWAECDIPFTGATLYGQLQTLNVFTPASGETFTISLWYLPG